MWSPAFGTVRRRNVSKIAMHSTVARAGMRSRRRTTSVLPRCVSDVTSMRPSLQPNGPNTATIAWREKFAELAKQFSY